MKVLETVKNLLEENKIKEAEKFLKETLKDYLSLDFYEKLKRNKNNSINFFMENISSVLVISCHNIKHLLKSVETEASLILFNLEDGVKKEYKNLARLILIYFLLNFEVKKPYLIRINKDEHFLEDIYQILALNPIGIRVPKTTLEDIYFLSNLVEKYFEKNKFIFGISVETKDTLKSIDKIFKIASEKFKNIVGFVGIYDLKAEMPFLEKEFFKDIKKDLALKFNIFNIYPVGSAYQNYKDLEGFLKEALEEKVMGYKAKFCIGPSQVQIANKIFSKNKDLLNWAKNIVEKFEKKGPFYENGMFIDEPIYKKALNILKTSFN